MYLKFKKGGIIIITTLGIFLIGVGVMDFCFKKISSLWLLVGVIFGVIWLGYHFFIPFFVMLLLMFFLYQIKAMGGADGKIIAILVGYLGFKQGLIVVLFGILVAGIWAFVIIIQSGYLKTYLSSIYCCILHIMHHKNLHSFTPIGTVPFATCLSIGAAIYYGIGIYGIIVK